MFWHKMRTAAALVLAAIGCCFGFVQLFASASGRERVQASEPRTFVIKTPRVNPQDEKTKTKYRLMGSVKVEDTGEPVAGAKLLVMVRGSGSFDAQPEVHEIKSGMDGEFIREVPPGDVASSDGHPPAGFWVPESRQRIEQIAFGPETSVFRADYLVRRGTDLGFSLDQGDERSSPIGNRIVRTPFSGLG